MKKNKMMRAASALLVAVLLTTCAVSGTFAKYVTSDAAEDSARVAKWGVKVTATGDEAFAEKYDNEANAAGTKVVSSVSGEDVLAPGTNGTLGGIAITGTPEVMVDVDVTANLTLTGWTITGDWDNDPSTPDTPKDYCPIVFTINGVTYGTGQGVVIPTNISTDIADLETDVENAIKDTFSSLTDDNVGANEALDSSVSVSWAWDFNTAGTGDYDKYDTALGDLAADATNPTDPTIAFTTTATVTQVD